MLRQTIIKAETSETLTQRDSARERAQHDDDVLSTKPGAPIIPSLRIKRSES